MSDIIHNDKVRDAALRMADHFEELGEAFEAFCVGLEADDLVRMNRALGMLSEAAQQSQSEALQLRFELKRVAYLRKRQVS